MKKIALGLFFLGLGAVAWGVYLHSRTAPTIYVAMEDTKTLSGGSVGAPALDGYVGGSRCTDGFSNQSQSFKVTANPAGKLFVLAHYEISKIGDDRASEQCDVALPILDKAPDIAEWHKIDEHLAVCAYYVLGSTINY